MLEEVFCQGRRSTKPNQTKSLEPFVRFFVWLVDHAFSAEGKHKKESKTPPMDDAALVFVLQKDIMLDQWE